MSTNPVMDTNVPDRRRYRSWPESVKREIVAASLAPGASVSLVARRYDMNTNQAVRLAQALSRRLAGTVGSEPAFAGPGAGRAGAGHRRWAIASRRRPDRDRACGRLSCSRRQRGRGVALRRVLDVLERR